MFSVRSHAPWRVPAFVVMLAWAATVAPGIAAQSVGEPASREREPKAAAPRTWQVGPLFGVARHSPASLFLGTTPGRDHLFLGIQAVTPVRRVGRGTLAYAVQILPVVLISGRTAPRYYPGGLAPDGLLPVPARVYAFGFSPLGFELATPQENRLSVFGAAAGGVLLFRRPFPVPEADRLNFTFELGVGARLRTRPNQWLQLGYKLHHRSNAYRADMNPGVDGHVFHAGYQWSTRFRR